MGDEIAFLLHLLGRDEEKEKRLIAYATETLGLIFDHKFIEDHRDIEEIAGENPSVSGEAAPESPEDIEAPPPGVVRH